MKPKKKKAEPRANAIQPSFDHPEKAVTRSVAEPSQAVKRHWHMVISRWRADARRRAARIARAHRKVQS